MKPRKFNSVFPRVNHEWAARVLGMLVNPGRGCDLIDETKGVELKFTLPSTYCKWTVLEHQMAYGEKRECYWGLGTYELALPVSRIFGRNPETLETFVKKRELFLINWDWMNQFAPHPTSGETDFSCWNHTLRYPTSRYLPEVIKSYQVEKGLVHLTRDVAPEIFRFS